MGWQYKLLFFGAAETVQLRRYDGSYERLVHYGPLRDGDVPPDVNWLELPRNPKLEAFISTSTAMVLTELDSTNPVVWGWQELPDEDADLLLNSAHNHDPAWVDKPWYATQGRSDA